MRLVEKDNVLMNIDCIIAEIKDMPKEERHIALKVLDKVEKRINVIPSVDAIPTYWIYEKINALYMKYRQMNELDKIKIMEIESWRKLITMWRKENETD
jgi:hypothetical protein